MFETPEEVIGWLDNRLKFGIKPGLERMERLMAALGHPERYIRAVHVGGTNGKGSTVAFLRAIVEEAGLEAGTFTSPHMDHPCERIAVNGRPIGGKDLIACAEAVLPAVERLDREGNPPTEFEILTAMALHYFAFVHPVDVAVFEVGLGGRLDSTNVLHPLVSVITNVGHDHMNILGSTLKEIAAEKAGIIKNGVPLVTAARGEALETVAGTAKEKRAAVYRLGKQFQYTDLGPAENGERFSLQLVFKTFPDLEIGMFGRHQLENASLAAMAAYLLQTYYSFFIEDEHIAEGLKKAEWKGRFQIVSRRPLVILDGAHNPEGTASLSETFQRHFPDKKATVLFSALKDKPLAEMIAILDQLGGKLVFTEFSHPRGERAERLLSLSRAADKRAVKDWKGELARLIGGLTGEEALIVTGSLYFIAAVHPVVQKILKL